MFPQFDPSKMDPQVLMQLSQLIQQLPPEQLNKMQGLMHNAMAGYDVKAQMEEFERSLPAGFREKLMALIATNPAAFMPPGGDPISAVGPNAPSSAAPEPLSADLSSDKMDMREARLTVLRGVANGQVTPEDAERLLFK